LHDADIFCNRTTEIAKQECRGKIMSRIILVTGATGEIAEHLIPALQTSSFFVRALVRNPDKAAALAQTGVEIVEGSFEDSEALNNATEGADSIVLITSPNPDAATQTHNVLAAARKSGSPRIIRISALKATAEGPTDKRNTDYAA
jgi:uncharacterized protein YbjT (DUF2867 family)